MNFIFLKVPTSVPLPHPDLHSLCWVSCLRGTWEGMVFINLVVQQHIVMVHQRTEGILLSWNGTLGSWPPNYFSVLWALVVGMEVSLLPCLLLGLYGALFGISKLITILEMCNYFPLWEEMQTFWGENKTQPMAMNTEGSFRIMSPHISIHWK